MNKPASQKIGKLFYKTVTFGNNTKFHYFRKFYPKNVNKFIFTFSISLYDAKKQFKGFLKKYKVRNSLEFLDNSNYFHSIPKTTLKLISKKQSRIKTLKICLGTYNKFLDITEALIWLKYTKSLKEIYLTRIEWRNSNVLKRNNDILFWKNIRRHRLNTLVLDPNSFWEEFDKFMLYWKKIPSTVKKVFLRKVRSNTRLIMNNPEMSLPLLKNLKSLGFSYFQNVEVWERFFSSIHNPNQLVELSLEITGKTEKNFIIPQLNLQGGNQLRNLELKFDEVPIDISKFIDTFNSSKLRVFKIEVRDVYLKQKKNWFWIIDFLSHQLELEEIKIKINYTFSEFEQQERFYKSLIKVITSLKLLQKLKFLPLNYNKNVFRRNVISFKELHKLKNLKEICVKTNCMDIDNWKELIESSQKMSSQLKKLKIDAGKITPDHNDLREFRNLLNGLKSIEVLSFEKLEVPSSKFWKELVFSFTEMKNLRKLELGKINLENHEIYQGVLEVLKLPYLQRFKTEWKEFVFESCSDKKPLMYQTSPDKIINFLFKSIPFN